MCISPQTVIIIFFIFFSCATAGSAPVRIAAPAAAHPADDAINQVYARLTEAKARVLRVDLPVAA